MAENTLNNIRIKHKMDTSTNWSTKNPAIKKGELIIESDVNYSDDGDIKSDGTTIHIGKSDSSHVIADDETAEFIDKKQTVSTAKEIVNNHLVECTSEEYDGLPNSKYTDNKIYFISDDDESEQVPVIYGFHINPSESNPSDAVTYIKDAVGMIPVKMTSSGFSNGTWGNAFFMPKPCMVKYDGTVDYYLDPNDYSKKMDGSASDISNSSYEGNAMVEWPLIYYKFEQSGSVAGEGNFYVSNVKVDSSYVCYCNYDCDDNIIPHFYTAIYNGTGTSKLRSLSGIALTSTNGSGGTTTTTEITRATANNTTSSTEWYTAVLSDTELISMLLVLIGKSTDCQSVFGRGLITGGQSIKESYVTGMLNDKGMFWGDISGNNPVKVFGMENFWGCVWTRVAGMGGPSYKYKIKLTYGTADGSTSSGYSTSGTGYISIDVTQPTANGFLTKMTFNSKGVFPSATSGSSSTYYCDYVYRGNQYLMVGGCCFSTTGEYGGPFCMSLANVHSYSNWAVSTRLSLKPKKKSA